MEKSEGIERAAERCATGKTRLYVTADLAAGVPVELGRDQAHYLLNVLRLKEGAPILAFNGRDGEWLCALSEVRKKAASLLPERMTRAQEGLPDIWLLFAPVKKARLDYMVQKAAEMGAGVIQPVMTRFTNVARVKEERIEANLIEAAEQCGLLAVPEFREPQSLEKLLDGWSGQTPARRILFCDESAPPGSALAQLEGERGKGPFALLIGPEGGFAPEERERLLAREDTCALSLGPRIMRADTAAVAALAAVQLVLGDWRGDDG